MVTLHYSLADLIGTSIAAISAITAALLGYTNKKKINEVHVLVNSRLDEALGSLGRAMNRIDTLKKEAASGTAKVGSSDDVDSDPSGSVHVE